MRKVHRPVLCIPTIRLTRSGSIEVRHQDDLLETVLPLWSAQEIPVSAEMEAAFGVRPLRAFLGEDLACVFADEETARALEPDFARLSRLPGRPQNATAPGTQSDCATRSFGPQVGIQEDPVCGSVHCQTVPYRSSVLGKTIP